MPLRRYRRRRPLRRRRRIYRYRRYTRSYARYGRSWKRRIMRKPRIMRPVINYRQTIPSVMYTKLPYFDTNLVTDEKIDNTEYVYSLTSAFDPNFTGTGAQPRGWDQYITLYKSYQVLGVAYNAKFRVASSSSTAAIAVQYYCGMTAGNQAFSSNNFGSLLDYLEYPQSKYHKWRLTTRNTSLTETTANTVENRYDSGGIWKGYISNKNIQKMFGNTSANGLVYNYPADYCADITQDPLVQNYLTFWANSAAQNAQSVPTLYPLPYLYLEVRLVYYVKFFNPIYPQAS